MIIPPESLNPGITIPSSVTNLGNLAFEGTPNLTGVYFAGNAPSVGSAIFTSDKNVVVYYLPGITGWDAFATNVGVPTLLWNPQIQSGDSTFGVLNNQFGFNVTGTANIPIAVVACANPANPTWLPLQTCTLTNGSIYFTDPQWSNYPARLYRIRSP